MAFELAEPVWRSTDRANSKRARWSAQHWDHALRGGHTLCGIPADQHDWSDPVGRRCADCAAVPDGHAVHWDLAEAGLSYRQIDHWSRLGYIKAANQHPGTGYRRYWSADEAQVAVTMSWLVAAGLGLAAAERAARNDGWLAPGVRVALSSDHAE